LTCCQAEYCVGLEIIKKNYNTDHTHDITTNAHTYRFEYTRIKLKGIVHPKMKILSSLTNPYVVPFLLNNKEDILKNVSYGPH